MTNEEAIEIIKIAIAEVEWNYPMEYAIAFETAINALKKQIPEKPKLDNDNGIYETEHCPNCNRKLLPNEHHCKCGQALAWDDE